MRSLRGPRSVTIGHRVAIGCFGAAALATSVPAFAAPPAGEGESQDSAADTAAEHEPAKVAPEGAADAKSQAGATRSASPGGGASAGDEEDEVTDLEGDLEGDLSADFGDLLGTEVVSTATRMAEDANTAPATITVIGSEEIRLLGLTTINEVIQYFALGMSVQEDGGQQGAAPTVTARGVAIPGDGGNHMLVQINGHALNDPWGGWVYTDYRLGLPIEVIDHIEIVSGPGSVLYGASAMYGVINIVTKDAEAHKGLHLGVQGGLSFPGNANNDVVLPGNGLKLGHTARENIGFAHGFAVGDKRGEIIVHLERRDSQRPSHTYGPQVADWDPGPNQLPGGAWGGVGSAGGHVTDGFLGLRIGKFEIDAKVGSWRHRNLGDYAADFADPRNYERYTDARLDIRHSWLAKSGLELRSRAFGDFIDYRGNWTYSTPDWCIDVVGRCESYQLTKMGIVGAEEVLRWDWFADRRFTTLVAADVRGRIVDDRAGFLNYGQSTGTGEFLHYLAVTAAGSVSVQQIVAPTSWFSLNAGVRVDIDQLFGAKASPRIAMVLTPARGTSLKLSYAEAFRAPVAGELLFADPSYAVSAASLGGLRPEVVRNLEMSVEQKLPRGRGFLRVGTLMGWWRDLVGERALTDAEFTAAIADGRLAAGTLPETSVTYDNLSRILAWGGFASADVRSLDGRLRIGANLSGTQSRMGVGASPDTPRTAVAMVPNLIANWHVMFVPGRAIPAFSLGAYTNSVRRGVEDVDGAFVDSRPRRAGPLVAGRFSIMGEIPKTGLGYGTWVDYTLGRRGPYFIGQQTYSDGLAFRGELTPLDRLSLWIGVTWNFDVVGAAKDRRERKRSASKSPP